MKKIKLPTEIAYILGLALIALGTCFMTKADFGLTMLAAPAYLLHILLTTNISPFFTFGRCEMFMEIFMIILMSIIIKKFKFGFLFSMVAGVIYGLMLDLWILIFKDLTVVTFFSRAFLFILSELFIALGIALIFKSYFPPAAYEFFVKEVSAYFNISIPVYKTGFDITFFFFFFIMSFAMFGFGHFEAIGIGTVIIALVNGALIGFFTTILDKIFSYIDVLPLRGTYF